MGRTTKASLYSVIDQGFVSIGNFATSVTVGRFAGLDGLGAYTLGFTVLVIGATIHEALVAIPYTVFGRRVDEEQRRTLAGASFVHALLIGAAMTGAVLTAAGIVWATGGDHEIRDVLAIVAAVMVLTMIREFGRRHAFAELDARIAVVIDGVATVVQLGGLGLLAATGNVSAGSVIGVIGVAAAITGGGWWWARRSLLDVRVGTVGTVWRQHWAFGRWVAAARLTSVAHSYVVNWLLAALLTIGDAGGYAAAATIVAVTNPLLIGAGMILTPRAAQAFADGGGDEVRRVARAATLRLTAMGTLLAIGLVLVGDLALDVAYGEEFAGFGSTVRVLALALIPSVIGMGAEAGLRAIERPSVSLAASVAGISTTVIVTLSVVPAHGPIGGAWAVLAGASVGALIRTWIFFRSGGIDADGQAHPAHA